MVQFSFKPNISFNAETKLVWVSLEPSFNDPTLSTVLLQTALQQAQCQDYFVLEDAVKKLLGLDHSLREQAQKIIDKLLPKSAKTGSKPESSDTECGTSEPKLDQTPQQIFSKLNQEPPQIAIAEQRDGKVEIAISDDHLTAFITLTKAYGGVAVDQPIIEKAAADAGIGIKLDQDVLDQALAAGSCDRAILAKGIEPVDGADSTFEKLVDDQLNTAPTIDEHGLANFYETNEFIVVDEGTPLMRRHPPTDGRNGLDVFGKVLPSAHGALLPFFEGIQGANVNPNDSNLLIATIKGHPIVHERGVSVDKTLHLKNANLATGNIDFDGSVCIEQDVADRISITATGDVVVKGEVGKATIDAGGDISIFQGLIGGISSTKDSVKYSSEENYYGAFIQAKGTVYAKFASNAKITAGDQIKVAEYAYFCDLFAENKIILGEPSGKGHMIGGNARAFELISARTLGSKGGVPTNLMVGAESDTLENFRNTIVDIKQKQTEVDEIQNMIKQILADAKAAGMNKQTMETIATLNAQLKQLALDIQNLIKLESRLKHLMVRSKKSLVICSQKIHNGVSISILGSCFKIKEEMAGGRFRYDAKRVQFER